MATNKWFKDSCPYCKDQGFMSVIGDVEAGESVIGFTHKMSGTQGATGAAALPVDTVAFKDQSLSSGGKVTNMADTDYKVFAIRSVTGAAPPSYQSNVSAQKKESFGFQGDAGTYYDIIVRGRILY
jgi:hypothetical protein